MSPRTPGPPVSFRSCSQPSAPPGKSLGVWTVEEGPEGWTGPRTGFWGLSSDAKGVTCLLRVLLTGHSPGKGRGGETGSAGTWACGSLRCGVRILTHSHSSQQHVPSPAFSCPVSPHPTPPSRHCTSPFTCWDEFSCPGLKPPSAAPAPRP